MATAASSSSSSTVAGPSSLTSETVPVNIGEKGDFTKPQTTADLEERESESPSTSRRRRSEQEEEGSLDDDQEDNNSLSGPNPTRDTLAEGIVSLLSPTLKTLDEGVLATKKSQEELSEQIALLTDQLKVIAAEQVCPIDLDGYVNRLGVIKGKINVISSVLHTAQDRLNKVHDQAIKEAARRKPLIEPSPVVSRPRPTTFSDSETESQEGADSNQNPTAEDNTKETDSASSPLEN